jgi:putative protease
VFSGEVGEPLTVTIKINETVKKGFSDEAAQEQTHVMHSERVLVASEKNCIDHSAIEKRFKSFNNAEFSLSELSTVDMPASVTIPFKELTTLKNNIAALLNDGKAVLPEVELPKLVRHAKKGDTAKLSLLICDESDISLGDITDADIYFKLPDAYKRGCTKYVSFFKENPRLIPWFPSVLIGKDYDVAVNILEQVKPKLIVTNNTGIANRAFELGIEWIAGPFLNTTNSYALLAMKESFNCSGAFISNEINRQQMKTIARPENFKMLYSVYHPILLMTSRQCFFQQSVGCEKPRIDNGCMLSCDKSTSITNLKGISFAIDKQKAGYPSIYNKDQFLNTEIMQDLTQLFDGFMIDLTNIGAGDNESPDKALLIEQFELLLKGDNKVSVGYSNELSAEQVSAQSKLNSLVPDSTNVQYHNGL